MNRSMRARMMMALMAICLTVLALAIMYYVPTEVGAGLHLAEWAPIIVAVVAFVLGRTVLHRVALASSDRDSGWSPQSAESN